METAKKKTVLSVCLFVVIFAGLLITATFTDLQVSKILVDLEPGCYFTDNVFGAVFESIGSSPAYLFLAAAFAIIFANTARAENKALKYLGSIAANGAAIAAMYVCLNDVVRYANEHLDCESVTKAGYFKILVIVLAVALAEICCAVFLKKVDPATAKALLKFSFVVIFAVALSNLIINVVVKNIMCRPRYRAMWALGDTEFTNFHRWYQKFYMPEEGDPLFIAAVQGNAVGHDAYRSFPSGHTNAAGTVYTLLVLPMLLKKYDTKKWRALLLVISIGITGIVAVSRIVCGAHFFSDVLVGGTIMFLCTLLGAKLFIRKDFEKV